MINLSNDLQVAAKELAGNHRKFQSFGWYNSPEDDHNWGIVYTSTRDSGLLDKSNEEVINRIMGQFENDVVFESHGHWACGHVDGFSIRVFDSSGNLTPAFIELHSIAMALADYPVLDESDYSEREYETTLANIEQIVGYVVRKIDQEPELPEDYPSKIFSWLWDNNQSSLENSDDQGGYPSEESINDCLIALGWVKGEKDE